MAQFQYLFDIKKNTLLLPDLILHSSHKSPCKIYTIYILVQLRNILIPLFQIPFNCFAIVVFLGQI